MKTNFKNAFAFIAFSTSFFACEDNDVVRGDKLVVQFDYTQIQISESNSEYPIRITFDRAATQNGEVIVSVDPVTNETFTTVPALNGNRINVPITKGDENVTLLIKPINNNVKEADKIFNFSIVAVPAQYVQGENNKLKITFKDDESPSANESTANFIDNTVTLDETNTTGAVYQIHLSDAVANGKIRVLFETGNAVYNTHFKTEPTLEGNILTLDVAPGQSVVTFKVVPLTNSEITGDLIISLKLSETTGNVKKGTHLTQTLTIQDDELRGVARGYEVTSNSDMIKRFYEYDQSGKISKVTWENFTPYRQSGIETYHYDANQRLTKINLYPGTDVEYLYDGDRITKSNKISNGVTTEYRLYDYDAKGNIAGSVSFYRQTDGNYLKGMTSLYLYYADGNIYKMQLYADDVKTKEPILLITRTYENYSDVDNQFPMIEILPNVNSQPKLPVKYTVEENGNTLVYYLTYDFRTDGRPEKRIAQSGSDVQTSVYHYY